MTFAQIEVSDQRIVHKTLENRGHVASATHIPHALKSGGIAALLAGIFAGLFDCVCLEEFSMLIIVLPLSC